MPGGEALNPRELSELQHWFQATCTNQQGPLTALEAAGIKASTFIQSDPRLPAEARLAIYARAYHARLRESLGDQFPVLYKVLEAPVFDGFVARFIAVHPPQGHSLFELGGEFARWLNHSRPKDEAWAEFIADLALFERIRDEVYHGSGHEAAAARIDPFGLGGFPDIRSLAPTPSLRLVHSRFPVDTYHAAIRAGETPTMPESGTHHIAIYRHHWRVKIQRLDEAERELLMTIQRGDKTLPVSPKTTVGMMNWLEMGLLIRKEVAFKDGR